MSFDRQNKRKIILLEEICFPFAISVFSKCFQIKYSRNLLGTKYYSTMVTFNSCTDTRQISVARNSRRYLILLVPFWKMMSFETIGLRFLVRNRAAFCLIRDLPQMQCGRMLTRHYHSTTARYELRNDLTFSLNINTDYTRIPTFQVWLVLCGAKRQRSKLVSIKSSFYARLLY